MNNNKCVCCGKIIPEGAQVCYICCKSFGKIIYRRWRYERVSY